MGQTSFFVEKSRFDSALPYRPIVNLLFAPMRTT
jgi:hypothetical protein